MGDRRADRHGRRGGVVAGGAPGVVDEPAGPRRRAGRGPRPGTVLGRRTGRTSGPHPRPLVHGRGGDADSRGRPGTRPGAAGRPGDGCGRGPGPGPGGSSAAHAPGRAVEPQLREGAYAILRIPRLGVVVPVAQGIDKRAVLDKGYAGHYPGTAAPGARGNLALAGHRNTHGEPFRYINRLRAGDELIVDVRGERYTYVVGKVLAQTTERDTGVIAPVPRSAVRPDQGYTEPGAYITLTTCTPEYTSRYRLVVWGTLRR
ncbi:class E sortase [Streptomyces sp. CA-243310]|uniref:class E sortase n=1 Tax=Streptomyces sp. CA-243310 TaxID=3240056 RepID=UPI003D8CA96C